MPEAEVLAENEVQSRLRELKGWELRDGRLRKQFVFRTFLRAVTFVNAIAYLAESAGHHPDIAINYNRVTLRLITHSAGGFTERDFQLASEIDDKLGTKLILPPEEGRSGA